MSSGPAIRRPEPGDYLAEIRDRAIPVRPVAKARRIPKEVPEICRRMRSWLDPSGNASGSAGTGSPGNLPAILSASMPECRDMIPVVKRHG
jgi:hypothetical protein